MNCNFKVRPLRFSYKSNSSTCSSMLTCISTLYSVTMYQRFNKLSLKKDSSTMSNCEYMDVMKDQVPSNQEAVIHDLDMSINLPETDRAVAATNIEIVEKIERILTSRLLYAKRKESISHGLSSGRFPSWFGAKLHCELSLPKEENTKFATFLKELQQETISSFGNSVIKFLERSIEEKEAESNRLRSDYLRQRKEELDGYTFAAEKSKLDEAIKAITKKQTSELHDHRIKLQTLPSHPSRPSHAANKSANNKFHDRSRIEGHYQYRGHRYIQRKRPY